MTEKEAEDLAKLRSLTGDWKPPEHQAALSLPEISFNPSLPTTSATEELQAALSLPELRAVWDEAQRNFGVISAEIKAVEDGLNDQISALKRQFEDKYAYLIALQQRSHDITIQAETDLYRAFLDRRYK